MTDPIFARGFDLAQSQYDSAEPPDDEPGEDDGDWDEWESEARAAAQQEREDAR